MHSRTRRVRAGLLRRKHKPPVAYPAPFGLTPEEAARHWQAVINMHAHEAAERLRLGRETER